MESIYSGYLYLPDIGAWLRSRGYFMCHPLIDLINLLIVCTVVVASLCDLLLAALPSAMLWNVQIKLQTKLIVGGLMGLGVL